MKQSATVVLVLLILVLSLICNTNSDEQKSDVIQPENSIKNSEYIQHDAILIENEADFEAQAIAEGWSGTGESGSPYVIENLQINYTLGSGSAIEIRNTKLFFTLRDCFLNGSGYESGVTSARGLRIYNSSNGYISSNLMQNFTFGIELEKSEDIVLFNNTCLGNYGGIRLAYAEEIDILSNTCNENLYGIGIGGRNNTYSSNLVLNCGIGIYGGLSQGAIIFNNTCISNGEGMRILGGSLGLIYQNKLYDCGYGIRLCWASSLKCYNNLIDNSYEAFDLDESYYNRIYNNSFHAVISAVTGYLSNYNNISEVNETIFLWKSDYNTIKNNVLSSEMIILCNASYNTIVNNTITDSSWEGIKIYQDSNSNLVVNNTCTDNNIGISLSENSEGNTITNNTCSLNDASGIEISNSISNSITNNLCDQNGVVGIRLTSCEKNSVTWNTLTNDAEVSGPYNVQDLTRTGENIFRYNYYDDYSGTDLDLDTFGDTPYQIPGTSNEYEYYPLMATSDRSAPFWHPTPRTYTVEEGIPIEYNFSVSSKNSIDSIWLNDTTHFSIESNSAIRNTTFLSSGEYSLSLFANDSLGQTQIVPLLINITTADNPNITDVTQNPEPVNYGESVEIDCNVFDTQSEISMVELYYRENGNDWNIEEMDNLAGKTYSATIEAYEYLDFVEYFIKAFDQAGHYSINDNESHYFSYIVGDAINPSIADIIQTPSTVTYLDTVSLSCNATDDGSGISSIQLVCRVDSGSWIASEMSTSIEDVYNFTFPQYASGETIEYYLNATDNAGNWIVDDNDSSYYSFTIDDPTPPIIEITSHTNNTCVRDVVTIELNAEDLGSGINTIALYIGGSLLSVDNAEPYSLTWVSNAEEDGNYTLEIIASDNMGNSKVVHLYLTVDTTVPVLSQPADLEFEKGVADTTVTWTCTDINPDQYQLMINDTLLTSDSWDGGSIITDVSDLEPGSYNLTLTVYDKCGNSAKDSVIVSVLPTEGPIIEFVNYPETLAIDESVAVNASVSDISGVSSVILMYSIDGGTSWMNITMEKEEGLWIVSIPGISNPVVLKFKLYAFDSLDNFTISETFEIIITETATGTSTTTTSTTTSTSTTTGTSTTTSSSGTTSDSLTTPSEPVDELGLVVVAYIGLPAVIAFAILVFIKRRS